MTSPTDHDSIRDGVSRHYSKALSLAEGSSCGPSCCGPVTDLAGYSATELDELEGGASFGCGNPLSMSEVGTGDVVLDLGSGAGLDLLLAARLVGPTGRVIGVDMTGDMIERARANIDAAGFSDFVEVREGLIEALPVPDASVDHVISNCVINLSPDKDAVFAEIARVLKPGGRVSISDIVAKDLPEAVRNDALFHASCIGGAIAEEDYAAGLEAAGLSDVRAVDRFVYDEQMVAGIAETELVGLMSAGQEEPASGGCCSGEEKASASSCCGGEEQPTASHGCCGGEEAAASSCCSGGELDPDRVRELAKLSAGRFWSVRFVGTRAG
jgi:SAM-dependent methyltransferase